MYITNKNITTNIDNSKNPLPVNYIEFNTFI